MSWTDESKAEVVEAYVAAIEAAGDDAEAVQAASEGMLVSLAEQYNKTPAGVRVILSRENVYVKKTPKAKASATAAEGKAPRVNKAEALAELTDLITGIDTELVDEAIISKFTGKAALWLTTVIKASQEQA